MRLLEDIIMTLGQELPIGNLKILYHVKRPIIFILYKFSFYVKRVGTILVKALPQKQGNFSIVCQLFRLYMDYTNQS